MAFVVVFEAFHPCFRSLAMQMMQVFWTADDANDASCLGVMCR